MGKWYENCYRRCIFDMQIGAHDPRYLTAFDPCKYVDCLKKARMQSAIFLLSSHEGYCSWDASNGHTYAALKNNQKMKRMFRLCRENGIHTVGYYSIVFNNALYAEHPEWRLIQADGTPSRENPERKRFGMICPNHAGYREYIRRDFDEICEEIEFDGMFLDMTFYPLVCHCEACKRRYMDECGKPIPAIADWTDPDWREFQRARQRWIAEFAQWCSSVIHAHRPDATVMHQSVTLLHAWYAGVDGGMNEASEYTGGDLYGGYLEQSYACKLFYEATRNQPFEYMTTRCDPGLNAHTLTKSLEQLTIHNYLTLAHHGALLLVDGVEPSGDINPMVYERYLCVFERTMPYEQYLTGELVSEAAIIMSYDSKLDALAPAAPVMQASTFNAQKAAQLGLSDALRGMRMLYTVLPNNRLERLKDKRAAFLSNACILRDDEIDQIEAFVREGGRLYMSGTTDERLVKRLLGAECVGYTHESVTYIAPAREREAAFGGDFNAMFPMPCNVRQRLIKLHDAHEVLARVVLPYTDPEDGKAFSSIYSNPPGILTDSPAVVLANCGRGRVMWVSAAIEANCAPACKSAVQGLIRLLCEPDVIASDAHDSVEFTLFKDDAKYLLSAVSAQPGAPAIPVPEFNVCIKLPGEVKRVSLLPNGEELAFQRTGCRVSFQLALPELFNMVLLDMA